MEEGPGIDWDAFAAADSAKFEALLAKLPRARWAERDQLGRTLLHFACRTSSVKAVVLLAQCAEIDVNARDQALWTPMHTAACHGSRRVVEVLLVLGADPLARTAVGHTAADYAGIKGQLILQTLLANGVRLRTANCDPSLISPEYVYFERGVLRCRSAVAALLRVKSVGELRTWDRFLLREIALSLWATRSYGGWQE